MASERLLSQTFGTPEVAFLKDAAMSPDCHSSSAYYSDGEQKMTNMNARVLESASFP